MALKHVTEFQGIIIFFQYHKKSEPLQFAFFTYYLLNFIFCPTGNFWDFAKMPHI